MDIVENITDMKGFVLRAHCHETYTVAWTAGVRGEPELKNWGLPTNSNGRVTVLNTLQVPGYPNVYTVGDLAYLKDDELPVPFHYKDQGTMVVIGRNAAVVHLFKRLYFTGFLAWIIWLAIHLFSLIGFRNRFLVLINWAWDYIYYERVVRLILPTKSSSL